MSCCGIDCDCNDISKCVDCKFYEFALKRLLKDLREFIEDEKSKNDDKMLRDTVAELCEAKRRLKAAIEDMTGMQFGEECKVCSKKLLPNECPVHNNVACILEKDFKWRHADEALKLIGSETDE